MAYPLRSCVWEITLACCFQCKYCGSSGGKARKEELSTQECVSLCNQLAELGCERVNLIGGEVFMRKDWPIIAKRFAKLHIPVTIITNGYLFQEDLIQQIQDCQIASIAVSLDGPKEIHDAYRQKGSYERAVTAIETLTRHQIPVSVITTLRKDNVPYLETFYQQLCRYPIFAWQLQACSPMGNAADGKVDVRFDAKEVISFVEEHVFTSPFIIGIGDNIGYFSEKEEYLRGYRTGNLPFPGCRAGLTTIGIDSVGNIKGCESMYDPCFIEGNIREESLETIWNDPNRFSYNRQYSKDLLTGACRQCTNKEQCGGGCRSYNYFMHKKLYESPACIHRQQHK